MKVSGRDFTSVFHFMPAKHFPFFFFFLLLFGTFLFHHPNSTSKREENLSSKRHFPSHGAATVSGIGFTLQ